MARRRTDELLDRSAAAEERFGRSAFLAPAKRAASADVDRSRSEDGSCRYVPERAAPLFGGSTRGTSTAAGRTAVPFQLGMVSRIVAFPGPASSGTRTRPANRTNPCRR